MRDYVETLDVCHHGIDRSDPCAGCASEKFARVIPEPESPPDWLGYGALAAYAAALTVLGIALLRWVA